MRKEFPNCEVVSCRKAMEGHEDEMTKVLTLLMYLGSVKHQDPDLYDSLQVMTSLNNSRAVAIYKTWLFHFLLSRASAKRPNYV